MSGGERKGIGVEGFQCLRPARQSGRARYLAFRVRLLRMEADGLRGYAPRAVE